MPSMPKTLIAVLLFAASVAQAQTVSYFRTERPATSIAAGPDGNLWFVGGVDVGRMTPLGEVTIFPVPYSTSSPYGNTGIVAGPNHLMWFIRPGGLSAIDMQGTVTKYDTSAQPVSLAAGANEVWFGSFDSIGRVAKTGVVTLFPLPKEYREKEVMSLAVDAKGNVWFNEVPYSQLGGMGPSGGVIESSLCCGSPGRIATGPDSISLTLGKKIERRSNSITQVYDLPHGEGIGSAEFSALTYAPDGQLWFGTYSQFMGSASPTGVHIIAIPGIWMGIRDLTVGADGNIWGAAEPAPHSCNVICLPLAEPDVTIVRVNLFNPSPRITSIPKGNDPATKAATLSIHGLGFVPNSVIRWNGIDRSTIYISPYELQLAPTEANLALAYGGSFVAHNPTPGGGDSLAFTLPPAPSLRRRAVH
jgi:streptogramin lyase